MKTYPVGELAHMRETRAKHLAGSSSGFCGHDVTGCSTRDARLTDIRLLHAMLRGSATDARGSLRVFLSRVHLMLSSFFFTIIFPLQRL